MTFLPTNAIPPPNTTCPSKPLLNDIDILNFALLLEYLEATFYDTNVPKFYK